MVKARKFVVVKHSDDGPKEDDFKLVEEELPPLKDGEMLVEAVWLSVDPYMRGYSDRPLGITMYGSQVSRIVESRNKDFPVGKLVFAGIGWQDKAVISSDDPDLTGRPRHYILPDFRGHPESLGLGVLGMPGNTALFGFLDICKPKEGDVVVVTGAAGAVGSIVGQIAKIKGCKVIGFAGSDEKVKLLTSKLGFDQAFNYKTTDIDEALKKAAPDGVDCYFDNVGGDISSTVLRHMKEFGRISACGFISSKKSKDSKTPTGVILPPSVVGKQLRIEGFLARRFRDKWMVGINQLLQWILEGKLKYYETVTEGFENMPKAFIEMLQGKNIGKAIVKF